MSLSEPPKGWITRRILSRIGLPKLRVCSINHIERICRYFPLLRLLATRRIRNRQMASFTQATELATVRRADSRFRSDLEVQKRTLRVG